MSEPSEEATTTTYDRPAIRPGSDSTRNPSQDAYESLMELLGRIGISPTYARVDWAVDDSEAPILVGHLNVGSVLRLNRALRAVLEPVGPPSILADRPHRPLVGETVVDTASGDLGEVTGYQLRPLAPGEPWTADPNNIRRPDRDRLIQARMARLDLNRRSAPQLL
ncbi:hypothetical protein ABZX40_08335 [Streptomyces sp. NPDC004610]|uniref:hypothetical protein n=1 Tax=unclassified Streptomyces TaxID=2593676 RepID=UPI0033B494FA